MSGGKDETRLATNWSLLRLGNKCTILFFIYFKFSVIKSFNISKFIKFLKFLH